MPGQSETDALKLLKDVGVVVGITMGIVLVLRFARGLLLKRVTGPLYRLVYSAVPGLHPLIRCTVGDLPILWASEITRDVMLETNFTVGFWTVSFYDEKVKHAEEAFIQLVEEQLVESARSISDVVFAASQDFSVGGPTVAVAFTEPKPFTYPTGPATVTSSASGRIQAGVLNVWEADP